MSCRNFAVPSEDKRRLKAFCKRFRLPFRRLSLLYRAFWHSSHAHRFEAHAQSGSDRAATEKKSNERLEFLGDAVLGMFIAEYLHARFPNKQEGDLSKLKGYVVSQYCLYKVALKLELDTQVLSRYNLEKDPSKYQALLADAVESLIAALYLDRGYRVTCRTMIPFFVPYVEEMLCGTHKKDFKSFLQKYVQQQYGTVPQYYCIEDAGACHEKIFTVQLEFAMHERMYSSRKASGKSKKEAEQKAAQFVCEDLKLQQ